MLHNYSENKCIDTQVLNNLVTAGFKGIACMFQVRHKLGLPVGDLKEAVDDVLSLHCLLQPSHGPLNCYFQWPPVAFHHKLSTTPANYPLGKAYCLLTWNYFCNTGIYPFEAWLSFHFITCSTWCNRCPLGGEMSNGWDKWRILWEILQSMKGSPLNSSSSCVEGIQTCIYMWN